MNENLSKSRFWFIEIQAYWLGLLNSRHIIDTFNVSRNQALKYIGAYREEYPDNLIYSDSLKGFIPAALFSPQYITGDANEYLEWLHNKSRSVMSGSNTTWTNASLNLPKRRVHPNIIRQLSQAIKLKRRLEVDYVSLKNPNGEGRIIQPYTFVKTGLRWHLRAYDEKHREFRDFVLSRFNETAEILQGKTIDPNQDHAWQTYIELKFIADLRLSPRQKRVIEQDYQMQNHELTINTRAALAQYVLQEMQVNIKFLDEYPEAQQLVLANKKDIQKWLFNT